MISKQLNYIDMLGICKIRCGQTNI